MPWTKAVEAAESEAKRKGGLTLSAVSTFVLKGKNGCRMVSQPPTAPRTTSTPAPSVCAMRNWGTMFRRSERVELLEWEKQWWVVDCIIHSIGFPSPTRFCLTSEGQNILPGNHSTRRNNFLEHTLQCLRDTTLASELLDDSWT